MATKKEEKYLDETRFPKIVLPLEREFKVGYGKRVNLMVNHLAQEMKKTRKTK